MSSTKEEIMNLKEIINSLYEKLEKHNCKAKIVSIKHLKELKENIERTHQSGLFDEEFYQRELIHFDFDIPRDFPEAKSLIVVAVPQPHVCLTFHPNGKPFPCLLPSTYSHKTDNRAKKIIESLLEPRGLSLQISKLPLKSLAVHCGLAQYGRNNISYVEGMGSFFRLVAFYSDLPNSEDNWGELKIMERCETCTVCQKMCPTGAIPSDRFLLRAERCISFFSEWPGEFPDWLDPSWHHCLVGCLMCQKTCPVNKDYANIVEDSVTFSQIETELILRETPANKLPHETLEKLEKLDISEYLGHLGRNLQILIDNQKIRCA
jgi:epoxyqueuosine reductase